MDACIARGGISHVLSQARASLKNPSRPFTPQTSARPLFHGEDYRPGSRPSSSYTVAELKQLAEQQTQQKPTPAVPKPAKLPPRPNSLKARPPVLPTATEKTTLTGNTSSGSLKLVHAPILSDDESEDELSVAGDDNGGTKEMQFDPEASLSLPSNDELLQSYDKVDRCIQEFVDQGDSPQFMADVERVRAMVDRFADLSSFFQAGSKQVAKRNVENATATRLRLQLFDTLSSRLLENWSANAACVLEFAPSLLDLYSGTGSASDDPEEAGSQIIKLGKTLFVLSKDSDNDSNFCNVRYVEAILHAIAEISDEASGNHDDKHSRDDERTIAISAKQQSIPMKTLIYAAGSLKNISNAEDKMARLLATNRAIAILSETMLWRSDDTATSKEIAQFMIQTTGILRNLSVSKSNHKQFLEAHIPQRLCCVIPAFIAHQELMVNISRILSKLTLHELPRAQINQSASNIQNLLDLINHRQNSWLSLVGQQRADVRFQDLLFIRVFFILGNLCAGNDQNRRLIASNGITIMLEILQFYGLHYSDSQRISDVAAINEQEECRRSVEGEQSSEVLIKLIRVIANLAINADVGARLNSCKGLTPLLGILEASQRMEDEELMLNAVSCVTNVSYYSNAPSKTAKGGAPSTDYCFIESNRVAITQLLSRILLDRNEEAVVEAARAFGNLSRFKDVLTYMEEVKVFDCLVVLLDHSNREVVYTVCGVLMNAALDDNMRRALLAVRPTVNDDTIDVRMLLVGIVECAGADDLEMTLIASKTLYNLLLCKNIACVTGAVNFTPDAINLHRCIEEVLGAIASHPSGNSKEAGELRHGAGEEELDSMSSRQELCLVLPQLLRSVDSFLDAV